MSQTFVLTDVEKTLTLKLKLTDVYVLQQLLEKGLLFVKKDKEVETIIKQYERLNQDKKLDALQLDKHEDGNEIVPHKMNHKFQDALNYKHVYRRPAKSREPTPEEMKLLKQECRERLKYCNSEDIQGKELNPNIPKSVNGKFGIVLPFGKPKEKEENEEVDEKDEKFGIKKYNIPLLNYRKKNGNCSFMLFGHFFNHNKDEKRSVRGIMVVDSGAEETFASSKLGVSLGCVYKEMRQDSPLAGAVTGDAYRSKMYFKPLGSLVFNANVGKYGWNFTSLIYNIWHFNVNFVNGNNAHNECTLVRSWNVEELPQDMLDEFIPEVQQQKFLAWESQVVLLGYEEIAELGWLLDADNDIIEPTRNEDSVLIDDIHKKIDSQ